LKPSAVIFAFQTFVSVNLRVILSSTSIEMSVLQPFEEYQKARVKFVQSVAEAATRPQNIEVMNNAGVMQLLRPLLLDNVSTSKYCLLFRGFILFCLGSQYSTNCSISFRKISKLF
jgi:hypothetical protein